MITLTRRYSFAAAHRLIGMRERHKCSRPHGHNYVLDVTVSGSLGNGLIVDAGDLDVLIAPVVAKIDHNDLNALAASEPEGAPIRILTQPSVENIATYLWGALGFLRRDSTGGFQLERLRVYENDRIWAEVTP